METKKLPFILVALTAILIQATCYNPPPKTQANKPDIENIKLPPGFHISYFAKNLENARSMTQSPSGIIFVGSRDANKLYALVDTNNDGQADKTYTLASNLNTPNGVAFHNGSLFYAEIDKVWRLDSIESHLANPPKPVLITDKLPHDTHHGWKYIAFGPDDKLYIPVGMPCNVCDDNDRDPRYGSIMRMNADGSDFEIFATGIRNTVGFDWNPKTKDLWFTENGRDMMGDNIPPDELNTAPKAGMNFGFPYCHAGTISDPEFGKRHDCKEFTAPVINLGPHVAALGMKFYTGQMFPAEFQNQIFIAEHGSWNRAEKIGYRISLVHFKTDGSPVYETFIDGWLKNGQVSGRPVDLLQLKDGSLLVSDDFGNAIYRITYSNN